ncbi:MAG: ABC transporter ATP-binding protein [Pseudacidovorax sp.]|uniref:ABC transporter ATP-binding protein n=1 Tax=Pseudacidovorax sp. TaxID=1934311 RepID=UPI001B73D78D|nr:ABC transporter ATP-binding protein [Pseudacidovorax sp.]MBP6895355.1 ABC transporter ATP-binding protein [Pseudacidovorax sp.]
MSDGIEFRNVTKRYGSDANAPLAVKGISFEVPKGTLTTILGPSGCGKTTTLRMIAGLESPSSGQILIGGRDVTTLGPAERNVSMMFQSYALFPHMNVIENVAYGLRMSRVAKAEVAARAREALRGVGLVGFDERLPSELSGGQQQRVALARALVLEPAVLLFDEPLSNLDARLRREMREEIRAIQQRLQLTVAYVTHDQGEALAVSDQIIVMDHGVIAQRGTPQALYNQPESEFVAGFMGEAMVFAGEVEADGRVRLGPIAWSAPQPLPAGPVKLAVRPEAWQIGAADGLPAVCAKAAYLGHGYEYSFDTPLGPVFVLSGHAGQPIAQGERTQLALGRQGVSVVRTAAA